MSIIEFHKLVRAKLFGAWWKYLRRLSVGNKTWMLLVMMSIAVMMPNAYAINVTVKSTSMSALTTSYHAAVVMPTGDIVSLMKGKKPISIPENEVVTSEDTEDYLEENSEEDYDAMIRKENSSGECFFFSIIPRLSPLVSVNCDTTIMFRNAHRESV